MARLVQGLHTDIYRYIAKFLTGRDCYGISGGIVYASEDDAPLDAKVVVVPSGALVYRDGSFVVQEPCHLPERWEGVPALFGKPNVNYKGRTAIVEIDVFAAVLYFASRQEELGTGVMKDKYGRVLGRSSYLATHGMLLVPILDIYANLIRSVMGLPSMDELPALNLTHDIDVPWYPYSLGRAIRSTFGSLKRRDPHIYYLMNYLQKPYSDPAYTFPRMVDLDGDAIRDLRIDASAIYFVKTGGNKEPEDSKPYFGSKAFAAMMKELESSGAKFGLHVSFEAGMYPEKTAEEADGLSRFLGYQVTESRNHYLASLNPSDMDALEECGITDDYTMGYADIAGFRLGTCRPLRRIDLQSNRLTGLTMHPLTLMEGTLFGGQYMNLSLEEAWACSKTMIDETIRYGGEINLLWHNASFADGKPELELYKRLLQYIGEACEPARIAELRKG